MSVRNGTFGLCGVFARPWVSEGGTVVETLGGYGFLCHCESLGIWASHCKWEPAADCDRNGLRRE